MKKTSLLFLSLLLSLSSCVELESTKVLKLAHNLDNTHSIHKAMLYMDEVLQEKSNGTMRIEVYPNQQLGKQRENIELLQIGSLDMTKASTGVLENFAPKMRVFGLPYLFKDKTHHFNVLDSEVGKELLEDGEKFWLKGLGYYDSGSRSFYSKNRPINTPEDLKGLKIRVMESVTAINMVRELGGSPTPISYGELYTSLQQGIVDGAENNPPSFYLSRHYEICKYYSMDEHTVLPDVILISTHSWNRLSETEQKWLQEAVDASVIYQRKLWTEAEKLAIEEVKKAGVEVSYPDKSIFVEAVSPLYDEASKDPILSELITKIKKHH